MHEVVKVASPETFAGGTSVPMPMQAVNASADGLADIVATGGQVDDGVDDTWRFKRGVALLQGELIDAPELEFKVKVAGKRGQTPERRLSVICVVKEL